MIKFDSPIKKYDYSNEEFKKLEGYLSVEDSRVTLARFLYNNLGITVELLFGIKLFPFQEVILRGWFEHGFIMNVWGRGVSKSFLAAIFCALYPVFFPNTKIVIASNSFRSTRRIINQIETFINAKGADLLKQCYSANPKGKIEFSRRADEMLMKINGGFIMALPLNEKVRGVRADILIIDEALQVPEPIYVNILMPFLTAKNNIQEQLEIQEYEDMLVKSKVIKDEDRTVLETDKKIIALTSASYDFEFVCRWYKEWVDKVITPEINSKRSYLVSRLSYKAVPEELIDKEIVKEAESGAENTAGFQREYMALFASSSDSYFNIKKLHENTFANGETPCVQLKGNKDSKYIVAADPSFSNAATSDFFAITVYLLNEDEKTITQVHSYAKAGGKLKDHIDYFLYIMLHFNVVFVIADLSGDGDGFNFIQVCNESSAFMERNLKLSFVEGDFNEQEYSEEIKKFRHSYNLQERKICYRQKYASGWIRMANESLQAQINKNKVKFASKLTGHEQQMDKSLKDKYPIIFENDGAQESGILDFIADQDDLIEQTKTQLALIEPKSTSMGVMQFDLPQHLKRDKSVNRARRDLYSCMVMANWGAKCYFDMRFFVDDKPKYEMFTPRLI